jgi:hypothetical protein
VGGWVKEVVGCWWLDGVVEGGKGGKETGMDAFTHFKLLVCLFNVD